MLTTITFDFWGTLYQNAFFQEERLQVLEEVLARHDQSRPRADLESAYHHAWTVWARIWKEEHRSLDYEHWIDAVLTFIKVDLPDDAIAGLREPMEDIYANSDEPLPVPGVSEVLPRLAQRYRLGLISDTGLTPGRVLRRILRRDGLLRYFQVLTFSDETGAAKPVPQQFLRTLDALQAQPDQAAHVGDLPETDLVGARGVGMKAILFLGVSNRQDGHSLADAVFEEYNELEKLLERLE